jgi:S1-C subfamily serine protease
VEPLTPDIAKQLGLEAGATGVIVADVDPTGTAAEGGIQRGDLIPEVNRQPVRSPAEIREELQKSGSKPVLLPVARDGKTYSLQRNLRASISHRFGLRRTFNQADIDETVEHELNSYCSK